MSVSLARRRPVATPSLARRALGLAGRVVAAPGNAIARFAYRGLQYTPSRQQRSSTVRSADSEFPGALRQRAWNTAFDLQQNLEVVGWMIRLYQRYVAELEFCPRTDDPVYNRELKAWYIERTSKKMLDVQRRLSLDRMFVTYQGLKSLSGYAAVLKVRGGKLQLMEAWHIGRGQGVEVDEQKYGVVVNRNGLVINQDGDNPGAIEWVALCSGDNSGALVHRQLAHHSQIILDGFSCRSGTANTLWESPLLAAFNKCADYLDTDEFELLKRKITAMFTVIWLRDHTKKGGADFKPYPGGTSAVVQDPSQTAATAPMPNIELLPGMVLQGDIGEEFKVIESKTPGDAYFPLCKKLCREILATHDIPYGFFDSEGTTYTTLRSDHNRFRDAVVGPRADLAVDKREGIRHVMRAGVTENMPIYPGGKYTVDNLPFNLVPTAKFMLDMSKEFPAVAAQIAAGLLDLETASHMLGNGEFYDTVDKLSDQLKYARVAGVSINLGSFSYEFTPNLADDEGNGAVKTKRKKKSEPDDEVVEDDGV